MYGKFFEQADSFFKPINELMALNVKALDAMREKQTDPVNEVMADSIEYAKDLAKPDIDVDAFVAKQQTYWEGLRTKISSNAQDNYDLISDVQGKMGDLLQDAWGATASAWDVAVTETAVTETETKAKPAKKKAPVKKAAPKAAATKAPSPKAPAEKVEKAEVEAAK